MQTLIIEAENDKIEALKNFLVAFGVNYRLKNPSLDDTTQYLLGNPANKKRLMESIEQLNSGQTVQHNLIEV